MKFKHFSTIFCYLTYLRKARSQYFIHSPFVYDLMMNVLKGADAPVAPQAEAERKKMLKNTSERLSVTDFGAGYGGKAVRKIEKSVAEIARSSARKAKTGSLLYRLIARYEPKNALELGTNLGFSACYQASALKSGKLHTVEGCPRLASKAGELFHLLGIEEKIEQHIGPFAEVLPALPVSEWNYVFIDGHHTYKAVMEYAAFFYDKMAPESFLIIDDIYWSEGMLRAWNELRAKDRVSVSINIFQMGILCFNRPQAKEDFILRF